MTGKSSFAYINDWYFARFHVQENVCLLVSDISSCLILNIYQISSKYSKGHSSRRHEIIAQSLANIARGDNS